MAYRVEVTRRARLDLLGIYDAIYDDESLAADAWFNGLEASVMSLGELPIRCPVTPEDPRLRHLLYGRKGRAYRVIHQIDEHAGAVRILPIRHGSRQACGADDLP